MRNMWLGCLFWALPAVGQTLIFQGEFSQITSQGEACSAVFAEAKYQTRFFLLESNRTAIVHFDHDSSEAFLKGLSLYGLIGYSNDIQVDRKLSKNGLEYHYFAEGAVSHDFLLMTVKVSAKDASGATVCTANAEYSGFN